MSNVQPMCPWCGRLMEKGTMCGARYWFIAEGKKHSLSVKLKPLVETEDGIFFNNWRECPEAYACRTCKKIVLPY